MICRYVAWRDMRELGPRLRGPSLGVEGVAEIGKLGNVSGTCRTMGKVSGSCRTLLESIAPYLQASS
jgi:hypothetical protein